VLRPRLIALVACLSLVPLGSVVQPSLASGSEPAAQRAAIQAAGAPAERSKPNYEATIRITEHGIPHITAKDFGSLGYGSGYAAAESSICTLADTLITGRGQRSLWFGPKARYDDQVSLEASNLQVDAFVTDLHNRKVVEKLLASKAGPGKQAREMVRGYVAGINKWLSTNKVTDPACKGDKYLKPNATELDVWYGVYLANLLASGGVFLKQIITASPPSLTDPGLPQLPLKAADVDKDALLKSLGRDPSSGFGSNATAIGGKDTSTGKGMLLGNPHFPWRGRYHFTQQHLTIPGKYNVAGASLIGSPAVNIGWNDNVAWSHTVSTAYRFTPYEYLTVGPGTAYLTPGGLKHAERRIVKVQVRRPNGSIGTVTEDLYRTAQGYVIDDPVQLMSWSPISFWAIRDANAEQLRTIDSFLNMGKAKNVRDLLRRQDKGGGIPWVNTTAADRRGNVLYADHSVVPNVSNALANRCMTVVGRLINQVAGLPGLNGNLADGRCAWGADADAQRPGILGPKNLPAVVRRDWVMNANDSYWLPNPDVRLEGYAHIIGCERCVRTMRTKMVMQYVIDRLASGKKETPASLRGHEHENRMRAAEVMRQNGDLDKVCAATGETAACAVLKRWDGRSERSSVGTQIFEEFVVRLPDNPWTVPFSAADPLHTPRGLNTSNAAVIRAMAEGIASLRQRKIPFDAPWGSLQVAGDRGAKPIGLGGGLGDEAGNANALVSRNPVDNAKKYYKAVTYGSSHIQAIAFLKGGKVDARTILTYGQSEDPTSPYSSDQTEMFGAGKWVRFAWTPAEIARDLVRVITLRS
jgi:acyl-homoserine-lactone acylase